MNKTMMITMGTAALATFAAMAQELPTPAAFPASAQGAGVEVGQSAEEFEVGALCKTYQMNFWHNNADALRAYLESAEELDKGYDVSKQRFDAKSVAKPGHKYGSATWEGRFNSPITEEFKFVVTEAPPCPFIVTINGKTVQGHGQQTLRVRLVKGIENTVFIANGSAEALSIEYSLAKYAKSPVYQLVPSNLKHIVEEECPDFKLQ